MNDTIIYHEDWQRERYDRFLARQSVMLGSPPPPPQDNVAYKIAARINQGRWIGDCPTPECGGAVCLSRELPLFWCPNCGNASNEGRWYTVQFPAAKAAIEAALLKRLTSYPFRATRRNWTPGETVADLKRENQLMGIV